MGNSVHDTLMAVAFGGKKSAGKSLPRKAINFHDFEGRIIHAFTREEVQSLSELPPLPKSDTLVATKWSKTLPQVKEIALNGGDVDVAPADTETSDGKTNIYILLPNGRTSPSLQLYLNGTVDIDWGDEGEHGKLTGLNVSSLYKLTHVYEKGGNYKLGLDLPTGTMNLLGAQSYGPKVLRFSDSSSGEKANDDVYQNSIYKLELGKNTTLGSYAFAIAYGLEDVVITKELSSITDHAFLNCPALKNVSISDSVTSIGVEAFKGCVSLKDAVIPDSVTSLGAGIFWGCRGLKRIQFGNGCQTLNRSAYECVSLIEASIPESVTTLDQTFYGCTSLSEITIPSTVTSMTSAFSGCAVLKSVHMKPATPPTINSSCFGSSPPSDLVIYVPEESVDTYKAAENWSGYASKIQAEPVGE